MAKRLACENGYYDDGAGNCIPKKRLLENEAKKYTSAKEFIGRIEASPIKKGDTIIARVYHGTPDGRFCEEFQPKKKGYFKNDPDAIADNTVYEELHGKGSVCGGFKKENDDIRIGRENQGIFFTDDYVVAASYADDKNAFDYQNAVPMVVKRYVKLDNPKVIDMMGKTWRGTYEAIETARREGYDGVIIKNVRDIYSKLEGRFKDYQKPATSYIVFNERQILTKDQLIEIWKKAHRK